MSDATAPKHAGHNRTKIIFQLAIVTGIYIWSYFGFSIIWLWLLVLFLASQKSNDRIKKSKWRIARRMALGFEKDVILKLNHVPSWVTFPDVDRAEWLNQIIKSLWPHVNQYMKEMIKTSIEPSLPTYLEFDKIEIGNVPLRIDGIKVYNNNETTRNLIKMDVDIVYAGDCRITCKAYGVEGGISNFRLSGKLRVDMQPLISQMPLIGAVKAYFLQEPDIDFNFGGATQVLTVAKENIKSIIVDVLNAQMLFPNFYYYALSDCEQVKETQNIKTVATKAILRVHLVEGKDLVAKDLGGKSDPYAIITLGSQEVRSKTIDATLHPAYNEWFEFEVQEHSELIVQMMDHDDISKDEKMGTIRINIYKLSRDALNDAWYTLTGVKSGQIHLQFQWMSLSSDFSLLDETKKFTQMQSPKLSNALFFIHIDSARDLCLANSTHVPEAYAIITLSNHSKQTKAVKKTADPTWDESFNFPIHNPDNDVMKIEVKDKKSKNSLGEFMFPLKDMEKHRNMEMQFKAFNLSKATNANAAITCSMKLFVLTAHNAKDVQNEDNEVNNNETALAKNEERKASFDDESRRGSIISKKSAAGEIASGIGVRMTIRYASHNETLYVVVHEAVNLPMTDTYVKVYLQPGKVKRKTSVIKQHSNPQYDAKLEYTLSASDSIHAKLEVLLLTEKKTFNRGNNLLGRVEINLEDFDYFYKPVNELFELK